MSTDNALSFEERLQAAIVASYKVDELDQMVQFRLSHRLDLLTPNPKTEQFKIVVFHLVGWATRNRRLPELTRAAAKYLQDSGGNPPELLALVQELDTTTTARFSWPEPQAPLDWPMADHSLVREAFARLIARDAPWRFLPIVGPSETGKSHITKRMLFNALSIPELACGRFDFKGTTGMDAEVRAFVQELCVPLPPPDRRLNERLGDILDELRRRARPTLLILDTYEASGEAQDWVEIQLLPCLIRATWLRVVIAGQRVPQVAGAGWASVACDRLVLVPPPPEEWFVFGQKYRPGLTLAWVQDACRFAGNKASLLAQLLGPETT
jgi:hypothetical protein